MFFKKKKPEPKPIELSRCSLEPIVEEQPQEEPKEEVKDKWVYLESDLIETLGFPKSILGELRTRSVRAFPASEWSGSQGKAIRYSEAGLEVLCKMFKLSVYDAKEALSNKDPVEAEGFIYAMSTKTNFPNPNIIKAVLADGSDLELTVRCGQNGAKNFVPGMVLRIRDIEGDTCWLHGPKPSRLGVW